jgi:poly(A) polymerase
MKIYLVGGAVRDKLLGIKSKDLDYVMVLDNIQNITVEDGYKIMRDYMIDEGYTIWLETPEMYTIRAKFPKGHKNEKQDADFVLARKEIGYEEGTRRPILELGTLEDDLGRRDFTINAMAEDEDGNIIDLFGGQKDLKNSLLRTPLDPNVTFMDDGLRVLRAFRFCITKDFRLSGAVIGAMDNPLVLEKLKEVVSQDRIREELLKMFKYNTLKTIELLSHADQTYCEGILDICFGGDIWLEPTFKKIK